MRKEVSVYLDFLRLSAGMAVFLGHSYIYTGRQWGYVVSGFATDAVAVFFVISGFVIAYVTTHRETTLQQYAIARFGRLYSVVVPAIILTLICDRIGLLADANWYVGQPWFNPDTSIADVARYLSFSDEYWNSHVIVGSDEPYWSIGFEACYYALFACFAFRCRNRLVNPLLAVLLLVVFGPKLALYLPLWLVGVGVFFLVRTINPATTRAAIAIWTLVLAADAMLYMGLRLIAHDHPELKANMFEPFELSAIYFSHVLYYLSVGLLAGLSIVAVAHLTGPLSGVVRLAAVPVRWLAGGTFTLYLMHQPILLMLVACFPGHPDTVGRALVIQLAALLAVYAVAEASERRKRLWTAAFAGLFAVAGRALAPFTARRRPS